MQNIRRAAPTAIFLVALLLAGAGIVLQAADTPEKPPGPREALNALLEQTEWKPQWVEEAQAYHVVFKGPDVWVRLSGEYVVVQCYLGRVPREVTANDLTRVLRRNYDLYEGKFGLDKDMDLWFEITTAKRILDAQELNRQIAYCADAGANASDLIKTEQPQVKPGPTPTVPPPTPPPSQ